MISLFDSVMAEYIRRVTSKETHMHYLGKNIQNEIITMLASQVQQEILTILRSAKYYSVILGCTQNRTDDHDCAFCHNTRRKSDQRAFLGVYRDN